MNNELKEMISKDERILYEGRPNKKCYVYESIFNPLLPFAVIWGMFDLTFIGGAAFIGGGFGLLVILPFLAIHMMPVWIYLAGVLAVRRKYKNTYYIVTTDGIYISSGLISKNFNHKSFAELSHVNLHRGFFDQKFGVGDIICTSAQNMNNTSSAAIRIDSIDNYTEVYNIVKKLQKDIYTDVMYPNDKRPAENHGYNTEYKD